jgi:hypothetical protein
VTFIGVVLYIQAFLSLVAGVAMVIYRDDSGVLEKVGSTSDEILGYGIAEIIAGAILLLVAASLMKGANWARWLVVIGVALRMGLALWAMYHHHGGAYLYQGLITIAIGVFVLWALFGNERAEEYFLSRSSATSR